MPLRIGTRGSKLALIQAERVRSLLEISGIAAEIVTIATSGDEGRRKVAVGAPAKGLYTKEIEERLLDGGIDLAVHSLKDLETSLPDGLVLGAFPERADPRDALVTKSGCAVDELPAGSSVGTCSIRRRAALLSIRNDLRVVELRGNVPTRLRKLADGEVDAAVMAMAGLERLQSTVGAVPFDVRAMVPAAGQGIIAVEARAGDAAVLEKAQAIDDAAIRIQAVAERAVLARLEGGCTAPIGATTVPVGSGHQLFAKVYAPDGSRYISGGCKLDPLGPRDPDDAAGCGRRLADELLAEGAAELMK